MREKERTERDRDRGKMSRRKHKTEIPLSKFKAENRDQYMRQIPHTNDLISLAQAYIAILIMNRYY